MMPQRPLDWMDAGWDASAMLDETILAALAEQDTEIDVRGVWPESSWRAAGALGVHRWHVPVEYGGDGMDRDALLGRGAQLAGSSLVLAFIASQHDAAVRRLAAVKTACAVSWLDRIARGEAIATVGLSHLTTSRRLGARPMLARPDGDGRYTLDGTMPWVTAATHADLIVTGAVLDDGRQILVALPTDREGVQVGTPLPLAALGASCTCEVGCRAVAIAPDEVLYGPATDVSRLPGLAGTGGLETSALAIGKARAAILGLFREAESRTELGASAEALAAEWRSAASMLLRSTREDGGERVEPGAVRVVANSLVLRATQAYLAASKGSGFVLGHPAQRWAREAMFFLVWSCPTPVSQAMIESFSC